LSDVDPSFLTEGRKINKYHATEVIKAIGAAAVAAAAAAVSRSTAADIAQRLR